MEIESHIVSSNVNEYNYLYFLIKLCNNVTSYSPTLLVLSFYLGAASCNLLCLCNTETQAAAWS